MTERYTATNFYAGLVVWWRFSVERAMSFVWRMRMLAHNTYVGPGARIIGGRRLQFGAGVIIQKDAVLAAGPNGVIRLGQRSRIGHSAILSAHELIEIGEDVLIADRTFIADHNHKFDDITRPVMAQGGTSPDPVKIGRGSWLGVNVCILGGVQLGEHCVVGANSVVTKSFGSYSVVAGIPACLIRKLK